MSKLIIEGGKPLSGTIKVGGAKNAVLPIMAATLLTREECELVEVPDILDVRNFIDILKDLGAKVEYQGQNLKIQAFAISKIRPDPELVKKMRASVVLLGAMLGRTKEIDLAFPGGDLIGKRPVDLHLRAFQAMGAEITNGDRIFIKAKRLAGSEVFAESSVTGTENIILAAVLAKGLTVIKLAALEPHVVALCEFLKLMGAKISGIGTHTLSIEGVKKLKGAKTKIIPDMIEAGSFAILGAATKSKIILENVDHSHLDAVYNKFKEIGISFDKQQQKLIINKPQNHYRPAFIRTGLYPNLATDLQPPFGVLATQCAGKTTIHDWIFEGRLGYLKELEKMGARVKQLDLHRAEIYGPTRLHGDTINSLDIRSGMTLLIASLVAMGRSEINDAHHIDRGYEKIDKRLQAIGADIKRIL